MKPFARLAAGLFLFLLGTGAAHAITTVPRDFDALVQRADTVFKGTVTDKVSRWTGAAENRHIVTFVTFRVEETYKGASAPEQKLRFLGGTVGDDTLEVPDMPQFEMGQRAVLFVVNNGKQFCPLVGIRQGRFHVVRDEATGRDRVLNDDRTPLRRTADLGQEPHQGSTETQAITAEDFRSEILGKAAIQAR